MARRTNSLWQGKKMRKDQADETSMKKSTVKQLSFNLKLINKLIKRGPEDADNLGCLRTKEKVTVSDAQ